MAIQIWVLTGTTLRTSVLKRTKVYRKAEREVATMFTLHYRFFAGGMLKAIVPVVLITVFFCIHAESQSYWSQRGCAMSAQQYAQVGQPLMMYPRTGTSNLDLAFERELQFLVSKFHVQPRFVFLDDKTSPNAYAHPSGLVVFGLNMIQKLLGESISGQGFGISAVLAHEFAHIVQFSNKTYRQPIKFPELHADYMAGWYLANREEYIPTDIRDGFHSLYNSGDYQFWSPDHHGTPQERLAAAIVGAGDKRMAVGEAFNNGRDFIGMVFRKGFTPLAWAATLNKIDTVVELLAAKSLLGRSANPDVVLDNASGASLLHFLTTTTESNEILTRVRQQVGGMISAPVDVRIAKILLDAGANPNVTARNGMTPLHKAVSTSDAQFVRALVDAHADPNTVAESPNGGRFTPLHAAAYLGDIDIVKILLEGGADPEIEASGAKPFWVAFERYKESSSKEMKRTFADIIKLLR